MVKLNSAQEIIGTDVLDHLSLVAATIDKLGIAKQIDKLMPMTSGAKTTKALESAPSLLYVGDAAMYANCVKQAMI